MDNVKIESYEINQDSLFYSGYVDNNYFSDTIDSSMHLFDEIRTKLEMKEFYSIESIIEDLLIGDYFRFMY